MALQVELVSPDGILFSGEADMVVARTLDGEIAFMTGHTPFLGTLAIGAVTVRLTDGGEKRAAVHGGFVEVNHDRVTILSDVAELSDQIDRGRAERDRQEAERLSTEDDAEAKDKLRQAQVRLEVADRAG